MKNNWQIKKLDEVCDIEYGTRVVNKRDGGSIHPVYGGGGATFFMDKYNREDCVVIARFAMSEQCTRFIKGKFFLNDSGLTVLPKNDKKIDKDFLNFQLIFLNDYIYSLARGAAQKNLDVPAFRVMEIMYPELISEQHRIVKILDEVFEKIEKVKENTEKNLKNARALFDSYLNNIFVNPEAGWKERKLKEVCTKLFAGGDVPKNNFSKVKNNKYNIPIFANGFKNKGLFGYTNIEKVIDPSITISARGTIGYAEIREESFFPVVRLIVLIPDTKIVDLCFLYYMTHNFKFSNTGTSIPQLTIPMIENIIIPIPDIKEQKNIITKLDNLSVETKKLEAIYKQKLADLEELKKSILKKAFLGEL